MSHNLSTTAGNGFRINDENKNTKKIAAIAPSATAPRAPESNSSAVAKTPTPFGSPILVRPPTAKRATSPKKKPRSVATASAATPKAKFYSDLNPHAQTFVPKGNYKQLLAEPQQRLAKKEAVFRALRAPVFVPNPDCPYSPQEIIKAFKDYYGM